MTIAKYNVKKVLIDSGSSTNVLFYNTFVWMNLSKNQLKHVSTSLVGFSRKSVRVEGELPFPSLFELYPDRVLFL